MSIVEPQRTAHWVVLLVQLPGEALQPAGILLLDPLKDELHIALAESVSTDEDIIDVWGGMADELARRASEVGGARLLEQLEELSHFIQIDGPRHHISTSNPKETLARLFKRYVVGNAALSHGS